MSDIPTDIEQLIKRLTPKELKFCQRYAQHLNAARAAREAGYSENSDYMIGSENLRKLHIKPVVKYYLEQDAMPPEEGVKILSNMGRGSFDVFTKEDGTIDLTSEKAKANIGLIKKLKQTKKVAPDGSEQVYTEIELHDAKDAVKTILEVHGKIVTHVQFLGKGDIEL